MVLPHLVHFNFFHGASLSGAPAASQVYASRVSLGVGLGIGYLFAISVILPALRSLP